MKFVDLGKQQEIIKIDLDRRIANVLNHGRYILGPEVQELEEKLCELTGAHHCVSCSSGTDALLLPLLSYELTSDDVVFVPSFTFAATAEAVVLAGGTPYFVDVDERSYNICSRSLKRAIEAALAKGMCLRGVIAVGLFGNPPNFEPLQRICSDYDLFLLDDAAQSLGSSYKSIPTGSIANVSATSFFPAKPLGCYGDGGAVFTDSAEDAQILASLRVHGKGAHKYDNVRVGTNARLDTLQAAILLAKLEVFPYELEKRNEVANLYERYLSSYLQTPERTEYSRSSWAQYTVCVDRRDSVRDELLSEGIPTMVYYEKPIHMQIAYEHYPRVDDLSTSENLAHRVLSLPIHPYLEDEEQLQVVDVLRSAIDKQDLG